MTVTTYYENESKSDYNCSLKVKDDRGRRHAAFFIYLLIGLGVMAVLFVSMHYWGKLSDQGKNKVLMLIFGVFFISIFVLLFLLMN